DIAEQRLLKAGPDVRQEDGSVGAFVGQFVQEKAYDLGGGRQQDVGYDIEVNQNLPENKKAGDTEIRKIFQDAGIFCGWGFVHPASPGRDLRGWGQEAFGNRPPARPFIRLPSAFR